MKPEFETFRLRLLAAIGSEPLYTWAARVGLNKATLNGCMTRHSIPKVEMLAQIAAILACSIDWLLGLESPYFQSQPPKDGAKLLSGDAIAQAVKLVERRVPDSRNLDIDARSALIALMFDSINAGMAEKELSAYLGKLAQICKPNALSDDERFIIDAYRNASSAKRTLMMSHFGKPDAVIQTG